MYRWRVVLIVLLVGFIVGLVYGWIVVAVGQTDVSVVDLQEDRRIDYLRQALDSYLLNNNLELLDSRYQQLEELGKETLKYILDSPGSLSQNQVQRFRQIFERRLAATDPVRANNPSATTINRFLPPIIVSLLLLVVLILPRLHFRKTRTWSSAARKEIGPEEPLPEGVFRTTYRSGDESYDDPLPIRSRSGEHLGDCIVSIAESTTLRGRRPKGVSALEVWITDTHDLEPVTRIVASPHAFNNKETHARLAHKGELVLAEEGNTFTIETSLFTLVFTVVEVTYLKVKKGALGHYFDRHVLEMTVSLKEEGNHVPVSV